ncbi:hypothetical protein GTQ43_33885, partial [Nostoc sp. KVJ3]|nr:hypothetical protein [Nostoc sp. KVJ3]
QEVVKQLVKSQQPADKLVRLIKKAIDQSIKSEPVLQNFLTWVFKKSGSIQANYKTSSDSSLYFALEYFYTRDLAQDFASDPIFVLDIALQFDIADDIYPSLTLVFPITFTSITILILLLSTTPLYLMTSLLPFILLVP